MNKHGKYYMRTLLLWGCAAILIGSLNLLGADKAAAQNQLRHVVSFKFKDSASAADIKKVEDAFRALKTKVPGIVALEYGTNISPENLNQGFTHCFILTFKTDKERDAYLVHPDHKAFGSLLGPYLDKVFVIDFWAKK